MVFVPSHKVGGQKGFLNERCLLYYKSRILDDPLVCRTRSRQDRCSAASTQSE